LRRCTGRIARAQPASRGGFGEGVAT
jgi:hypothetical protein